MARKSNRPTKAYKPRGLFAVSDKKPSRPPTLLEFLNPLSLPPGEIDAGKQGPTWGEVVVPPPANSPVNPPGLLEFLNPFSPPPGQTPAASPISMRGDNPSRPLPYRNDMPEFDPRMAAPQVPPGWLPPGQPQTVPPIVPEGMMVPPEPQYRFAPRFRLPAKRRGTKRETVT